jgi:hypothetical protein
MVLLSINKPKELLLITFAGEVGAEHCAQA